MTWTRWRSGRGMFYWQGYIHATGVGIWCTVYQNKGDTGLKPFRERFFMNSTLGFRKLNALNAKEAKKMAEGHLRRWIVSLYRVVYS